MKLYYSRRCGFTLFELLIVLAIIGILIAVCVPLVSGLLNGTKDAVCHTNRVILQRNILADYLTSAPEGMDAVERDALMRRALASYGDAELCPLHGVYSLNIVGDNAVVGCSQHSFTWSKGVKYEVGDIMITPSTAAGQEDILLVFKCRVAHKSGSRSNTRNPAVKSNKGSWELIGTATGEVPPYNSTVRFAEGTLCTYKGNYYSRTNYNLTGGQTPYSKSSSRYWILVGPVEP